MASALVVGIGYFAGAVVPVLPVLFGATGLLPTIVTAGAMIVAVSAIVAFISGMAVQRRIVLNLIITGIAVVVTWVNGLPPEALGEFVTRVNAVTPEQVRAAGRSFYPSATQTVVVVGDEVKVKAELAQFGAATTVQP
jgi:hypothetical protein